MKKAVLAIALILGAATALAVAPKDTYVVMNFGDPVPDFDPSQIYDTSSSEVTENIYETLVTYKGASVKDYIPALGTDWKITNGGRTYTFNLRKNVKFHSGNVMACDDAQWSFQRDMIITNADAWGGTIFGDVFLGTVDNAKDDPAHWSWDKLTHAVSCNAQGQLVFNLTKTDPSFLSKLAFSSASVIDKKFAVAGGEWNGSEKTWKDWIGKTLHDSYLSEHPSGTGAYKMVSKNPTSYLFKAFDAYWGGKPALENVIIQKVNEESTRILAIQKGDADRIVLGNGRPSLAQLQGASGVTIHDDLPNVVSNVVFLNQAIKGTEALGSGKFDGKGIPVNFFTDINVRKGFLAAFDYQKFIAQAQQGKGKIRTMALPESFLGYDPTIQAPKFSLEAATSYLKKAWGGKVWENGFTIPAIYNTGNLQRQTVGEILKANLEKINPKFHVLVQPQPFGTMNQLAAQGKLAIRIGGWSADYPDPDDFLPIFYASYGYYSPSLGMKDTQIDTLLRQAASTTSVAKRVALYKLVGARAAELSPVILLPAPITFDVTRSDLKGYYYNPILGGYVKWKDLSK